MATAEQTPADYRELDDDRLDLLAAWHTSVAGDDEGQRWFPWVIRSLPLETRLELATDKGARRDWENRERLRVERDARYFVANYGHVQPEQGPPLPFRFWPEQPNAREHAVGAATQAEVLDAFVREQLVVVLKARQLG